MTNDLSLDSPYTLFGANRWSVCLISLGFRANIINGYRSLYLPCYHKLSFSRYHTSPADCERLIRHLLANDYISPIGFCPDIERRAALSLGYNNAYINKLSFADRPVVGFMVDWNYEVLIEPASITTHIDAQRFNDAMDLYDYLVTRQKDARRGYPVWPYPVKRLNCNPISTLHVNSTDPTVNPTMEQSS